MGNKCKVDIKVCNTCSRNEQEVEFKHGRRLCVDCYKEKQKNYRAAAKATPEGKKRYKSYEKTRDMTKKKDSTRKSYIKLKDTSNYKTRAAISCKKFRSSTKGKIISQKMSRKRRALFYNCLGSHTNEEISSLLSSYNSCCGICGKSITRNCTIDHWHPLCKGGDNSVNNLVPTHKHCNSSKSSRTPIELFISKPLLPIHVSKGVLDYKPIKPLSYEPQEPLDIWDYVTKL